MGNNFIKRKKIFSIILIIVLGIFIFKLHNYEQEKKKFNIILGYGYEKEFNFKLFQYKLNKNILNTLEDTYKKDLILAGTVKTKLKLTEEEMNKIEKFILKEKILDYSEEIKSRINRFTPNFVSNLTIYREGKKKTIRWRPFAECMGGLEDETMEQVKTLNDFEELVTKIIKSKEEYKKLPERKGGYL